MPESRTRRRRTRYPAVERLRTTESCAWCRTRAGSSSTTTRAAEAPTRAGPGAGTTTSPARCTGRRAPTKIGRPAGGPSPAARPHSTGNGVALARVRYPLDAFELSEGELETVTAARYALTRQCVRRFGLDLPARQAGPVRAPRDDRYGLADENQ